MSSSSSSTTTTTGGAAPADHQGSPTSPGSSETDKPPTPASSLAPSTLPSGFPVGTFSFVTFLDTMQSGCTANAATWTCPPSTDYYSDPQKALTVLNWEISGSPGSYKISSKGQDATFGTMFQNEKLELLDSGKDTERFRFQLSRAKVVNMTGSIGDEKGDFTCDYGATNIGGALYTKMAKTYPPDTIAVQGAGNTPWPFGTFTPFFQYTHDSSANPICSCPRRTDSSRRRKRSLVQVEIRQHCQPEGTRCGYPVFMSLQELDTSEAVPAIDTKYNHFISYVHHSISLSFSEAFSAF
jgi:hypothetical protein